MPFYFELAMDFAAVFLKDPPIPGMSQDEVAAIHIYTLEWMEGHSIYEALNTALRMEDRAAMKPYSAYFRLLMHALGKVPRMSGTFLRGLDVNLYGKYAENEIIVWWAFTSCAKGGDPIEKGSFLGKTGTLFNIDASGVDIEPFSAFKKEREALLLPGVELQVRSFAKLPGSTFLVNLKEVKAQDDKAPIK